MLTQTIIANLTQSKLSSIIMRSEEQGREIAFSVIDEAGDPVDLTGYDMKFMLLKPDDNVVYADAPGGVVTQTAQMTTAKGTGYYCIRIMDDDTVIYSGQGRVLVDDHVIDDDTLNSISEVDGLIFPDDFATENWVIDYVDQHTGSDVIANPDTPPTDTLETVKIGETTYDIIHPAEDAEGNPIELTDAAAAPLVKCVSAIIGYQEGSGIPSPDNIRPIHAYTQSTISVWGRNLVEDTISGYSLASNGTMVSNSLFDMQVARIFKGHTYTVKYNTLLCGFYTSKPTWSSVTYDNQRVESSNTTFVAPIDGYIAFRTSSGYATPQMEVGTTTHDYVPYNPNSTDHTATFSQSIYQGNADFVGGKARATWGYIASYNGETLPGEWISSMDEYAPGTTPTTGAQVAYELASPTEETITPTNLPIKSLFGYNNIESSTGALDITYIKQPYDPIIRSAEQADNDLIRITAAYDAASLSNTDVSINYRDYDALVIYVNDALTQCGVSSLYTREYLDYCRANNRTLTFFPYGTAYISYNILTNKLEYAGDNNQGFYIIRIDGINFRR